MGIGGRRVLEGGGDVWCRRVEGFRCWMLEVLCGIGLYEVLEGCVKCVVMQDW